MGTQCTKTWLLFTALQLRSCSFAMSVCPSVHLSFKCVNCNKTKETSVHILILYERSMHLVFWHEQWLVGASPFNWNFGQNWPTPSKIWRKSATKFLCEKTFGNKVVRHSLACLSVHKWLVGDVPFYLKFWIKLTHPLEKGRIQIDIRS